MKDIDKQDTPEISGGFVPGDNGCIPTITFPDDFPQNPAGPLFPEALPDPSGPQPFSGVR